MRSTDKLVELLRMLAAPAEIQLAPPPADDLGPDEMVIDFGLELECWPADQLEDAVGSSNTQLIGWMMQRFDEQSGPNSFWEDEALRTDTKWEEIRRTARTILRDLDQPWMMPNCSAGFVDGKRQPGFDRPPVPKNLVALVEDL